MGSSALFLVFFVVGCLPCVVTPLSESTNFPEVANQYGGLVRHNIKEEGENQELLANNNNNSNNNNRRRRRDQSLPISVGRAAFAETCSATLLGPAVTGDTLISQDEFASFLADYCVAQGVCNANLRLTFADLPRPVQSVFTNPQCDESPYCSRDASDVVGYLYTPATQETVIPLIQQMCFNAYPLVVDFVAPTPVPSMVPPVPPTPPVSESQMAFEQSCSNTLLTSPVTSDNFISQVEYTDFLRNYCIGLQRCDPNVTLTFADLPNGLQLAFVNPCQTAYCSRDTTTDIGYLITPATRASVEASIHLLCGSIFDMASRLSAGAPHIPTAPIWTAPSPPTPATQPPSLTGNVTVTPRPTRVPRTPRPTQFPVMPPSVAPVGAPTPKIPSSVVTRAPAQTPTPRPTKSPVMPPFAPVLAQPTATNPTRAVPTAPVSSTMAPVSTPVSATPTPRNPTRPVPTAPVPPVPPTTAPTTPPTTATNPSSAVTPAPVGTGVPTVARQPVTSAPGLPTSMPSLGLNSVPSSTTSSPSGATTASPSTSSLTSGSQVGGRSTGARNPNLNRFGVIALSVAAASTLFMIIAMLGQQWYKQLCAQRKERASIVREIPGEEDNFLDES